MLLTDLIRQQPSTSAQECLQLLEEKGPEARTVDLSSVKWVEVDGSNRFEGARGTRWRGFYGPRKGRFLPHTSGVRATCFLQLRMGMVNPSEVQATVLCRRCSAPRCDNCKANAKAR